MWIDGVFSAVFYGIFGLCAMDAAYGLVMVGFLVAAAKIVLAIRGL